MPHISTRHYDLEAFLRDLSSEDRLPGSGAAGAIALALAAACAAKAISLKHAPENEELQQARAKLLAYVDAAIEGSDEDIERFARFLRQRSEAAARSVVVADLKLLALVDALTESLARLDDQVRQSVSGDLVAARALAQAARTIQTENIEELSSNTPEKKPRRSFDRRGLD
jgi:formiminotetrahydrofolate cyclodeaminase